MKPIAQDKKEVNKIQVFEPKEEELEKVRREPADKSIEGLKKIQINEADQERFFLLGQELSEQEKGELFRFLLENRKVLAWSLGHPRKCLE